MSGILQYRHINPAFRGVARFRRLLSKRMFCGAAFITGFRANIRGCKALHTRRGRVQDFYNMNRLLVAIVRVIFARENL